MIYSMTAFARNQSQGDWGRLVCEIRSVNHRYLEMSVYLPEALRALEMPFREHIQKTVKRGKLECVLNFKACVGQKDSLININHELAHALCLASTEISTMLVNSGNPSPTDILRFPGVLETKDVDLEKLKTPCMDLLDLTLKDLSATRAREGNELAQLCHQRASLIEEELGKIRQQLPKVLSDQRDRIHKRFNDLKLELDPARLEQEMVLYVQRIDVAEEIDRTQTHLAEVRRILDTGGVAGRRLDFLMQELNREANTLGSKSNDSIMTHAAVEIKVLIEQMREQVQNIE